MKKILETNLPFRVYSYKDSDFRDPLQSLFLTTVYDSESGEVVIDDERVVAYALNSSFIKIVFSPKCIEVEPQQVETIKDFPYPHLAGYYNPWRYRPQPIDFDELKAQFENRTFKVVVKVLDRSGIITQEEEHDNLVCEMVECRHDFSDAIECDEIRILLGMKEEVAAEKDNEFAEPKLPTE